MSTIEQTTVAPPIYRAAANLAAMQAEALRRLWEHGHVYAERRKP